MVNPPIAAAEYRSHMPSPTVSLCLSMTTFARDSAKVANCRYRAKIWDEKITLVPEVYRTRKLEIVSLSLVYSILEALGNVITLWNLSAKRNAVKHTYFPVVFPQLWGSLPTGLLAILT